MMKVIKRIFLSLSSFSIGGVMYLLTLDYFTSTRFSWKNICRPIAMIVLVLSFSMLVLEIITTNKFVKRDNLTVESIQPLEQEVVPSYLGLFVIMLGLGELTAINQWIVLVLVFLIWNLFMERSYYFNLLWLISYRYYKVSDQYGNEYVVYSKRKDFKKNEQVVTINDLIRINNFTFIEGAKQQ